MATRLGQPAINLIPHDLIPAGSLPTGTATIGARTEHIRIHKVAESVANSAAQGTVQWIEHMGDQNHLHLSVGDRKITTLVEPDTDLAVHDRVSLELVNPLYFDGAGERVRAGA